MYIKEKPTTAAISVRLIILTNSGDSRLQQNNSIHKNIAKLHHNNSGGTHVYVCLGELVIAVIHARDQITKIYKKSTAISARD